MNVNIEVVCSLHLEKLEVTTEPSGSFHSFRLSVSACGACLKLAVEEADADDLPAKTAELIFNESDLTSPND